MVFFCDAGNPSSYFSLTVLGVRFCLLPGIQGSGFRIKGSSLRRYACQEILIKISFGVLSKQGSPYEGPCSGIFIRGSRSEGLMEVAVL